MYENYTISFFVCNYRFPVILWEIPFMRFLCIMFLAFPAIAFSQTISIRGIVKNEIDSAMSYVTVAVKGGKTTTMTNSNGVFTLTVPTLPVSLVFSAVGYERKELAISTADSAIYISVRLAMATSALKDVMVTASPTVPLTALEGRAPGLSVGASKTISIRGTASYRSKGAASLYGSSSPGEYLPP
ncbi:carboxypeptidase-like regulatory domain-containing protein [Puia sp. P3]|uniref:carboxypeptidase-like regulatory domain-containing protein n=1 Tax=Puia sp. P3 TaxID=3423952 RepID=UPI003D67DEA3